MSFKSNIMILADKLLGPAACFIFSKAQRHVEYRRLDQNSRSALVIRPGGIGDAVMLLPALYAIGNILPNLKIDFFCESRNSKIFNMAFPGCRTTEYDSHPLSALKQLFTHKYDAVIDTEQFHNFSGVMTALSKAPLRIGFKINTNRHGLYTHLVSYDPDGSEDVQFCRLFEAAADRKLNMPKKFGLLKDALSEIPKVSVTPKEPYVFMHVGGSMRSKKWPEESFASLCDNIPENIGIVLSGSTADSKSAAKILATAKRKIQNVCGALDLFETAALCRDAAVFVGPDSGIAHLAAAAGTRSVVLFGPSDPQKWGPPPDCGEAVKEILPCSPCSLFGQTKPCADYVCIRSIPVDKVLNAIKRQLQKSGRI